MTKDLIYQYKGETMSVRRRVWKMAGEERQARKKDAELLLPRPKSRSARAPTLCKFRGIYDNCLRLPRLIPPCEGTRAAVPHIPRAKPGDGGGPRGRLPGQPQHPGLRCPVRTLTREISGE